MRPIRAWIALILAGMVTGCSGGAHFVHQTYDFSSVKKVAVLPLENLTQDQLAGERVRKVVIGELLATGVVDVIEPGQVNRALGLMSVQSAPGTAAPPPGISTDDLKKLGTGLGVQLIFLGSLDLYERVNLGGGSFPEVTISLRAVDPETGTIVWSATRSGGGVGIVGRLFGFGGDSMAEATQKTVRSALATLFQ